MNFKEIDSLLEKNILEHIRCFRLADEDFYQALEYSLIPAGKLFRPKLCLSHFADHMGEDRTLTELSNPKSALSLCCSSLEIHHTYTLIHDDLPCMDDDDMRRGRPSTHKKFGQWQAVLAGDTLLHHSHSLLAQISSENLYQALRFFNWALGGKGLILGQVYDLSGKMNKKFSYLIQTHLLKTARLIQTSLFLGYWCADSKAYSYNGLKNNLRLGEALGVSFQLLDDLSEGCEELNAHEESVNPFINFPEESFNSLNQYMQNINSFRENQKEGFLNQVLKQYFEKMRAIISSDLAQNESLIQKNFKAFSQDPKKWETLLANLL